MNTSIELKDMIIRQHGDQIWLEYRSGEGMQINKAAFEQLLKEYYDKNF